MVMGFKWPFDHLKFLAPPCAAVANELPLARKIR